MYAYTACVSAVLPLVTLIAGTAFEINIIYDCPDCYTYTFVTFSLMLYIYIFIYIQYMCGNVCKRWPLKWKMCEASLYISELSKVVYAAVNQSSSVIHQEKYIYMHTHIYKYIYIYTTFPFV